MATPVASLMIKVAADVAEVKKGLDDAGKTLQGFASKLDGVTQLFRVSIGALTVDRLVSEFNAAADATQAVAVEADKLATKYKLSTDAAQALLLVSERTGQSVEALVEHGKKNPQWLEDTAAAARNAGLVIDQSFVKGLVNAAERTKDLEARSKATFGAIAEMAKQTAVYIAEVLASAFGGGQSVERLEVAIAHAREAVKNLEGQRVGVVPEVLKRKKEELATMEQQLEAQKQWRKSLELTKQLELKPTTGGAAKAPEVDHFATTMTALKAEQAAMQAGMDVLTAATGKATAESEKLAKLQIDIGQRTASALKSAKTTDPVEIAQLEAAAELTERLKFKFDALVEVQRTALQVNQQYGDGTAELTERLRLLDEALRTGKIGQEEHTAATEEAVKKQRLQALATQKNIEGIQAFAAGMETAALGIMERYNDFNTGAALLENTFSSLTDAISEFATTGQLDFAKLARSFADMITQMTIKYFAAKALGLLLGGTGGGTGLPGSGTVFSAPPAAPARASGGPVSAFQPYLVGERGPELFVPRGAGNVVPNSQLGASDGGGITVNVEMRKAEGAANPAAAIEFGRRVKLAVQDVIEQEKRPGGTLYSRGTA